MIDAIAILATSLFVLFVGIRAAILDSRERADSKGRRPSPGRPDED